MKKLLSLLVLSLFIMMISPISTLASVPISTTSPVLSDKIWTITFGKDVDQISAIQNISMWKFSNQWNQIVIQPAISGNKVSINHNLPYSDGQYELRISKNIRSVNNETMSNDVNFDFSVQSLVSTTTGSALTWPIELQHEPQIIDYGHGIDIKISIKREYVDKIKSISILGINAVQAWDNMWDVIFPYGTDTPKTLEDIQDKIIITYK